MNEISRFQLGVQDLAVVITQDGDHWFAQGMQIDYAASGTSLEDVQERFVRGFVKSIVLNSQRFGSLDNFLRYPPQREIEELQRLADSATVSMDIKCIGERVVEELPVPFTGKIRFFRPEYAPA